MSVLLVLSVFFGTVWSSIKEIEAPYVFDWEHSIALNAMQGQWAASSGKGKVSSVFSRCGRNFGYVLKLQHGWPFETQVCSAKSELLANYDGQLRNLN